MRQRKEYILRALTTEGRQACFRVSALSIAAVRRAALNDVRLLEIQDIQRAYTDGYPDWFLGSKA